jgi:hypothetical protein
MQFKEGDILTLHDVNEIRLGLKMPAFNEDIEGLEVTFMSYERPYQENEMCRVSGINVTRKIPGAYWKDKPMDISRIMIPEKCLKLK